MIEHARRSSDTLREALSSMPRRFVDCFLGPGVPETSNAHSDVETFWALKEVSFEVRRGQVLGVIGANGAGKSTLLKILARIMEPSEGRVTISGRLASLLEVGTGFHPELSGRENIYLNGAILGMTREEVKRKFDEIIAFADVDKFLDTPVKRYSSGMYVRLAFAVAAHLEPEILILDEILAVGDAEFQKKCLTRMSEAARSGRTVLCVSHHIGSIAALCDSAILLRNGRLMANGPTEEVIEAYIATPSKGLQLTFPPRGMPTIVGLSVDQQALQRGSLELGMEFCSPYPLTAAVGGVVISTSAGAPVWGSNCRFHPMKEPLAKGRSGSLICRATDLPLIPATYNLSVWLGDWQEDFDEKLNVIAFEFKGGLAPSHRPPASLVGPVDWPASWSIE